MIAKFSTSIKDCDPFLQDRWPLLKKEFEKATGHELFLTCTWRSPAAQYELFLKGRQTPGEPCWHRGESKPRPIGACKEHKLGLTVTKINGTTTLGRHNVYPARAFDVCVDLDHDIMKRRISYDYRLYAPLVNICKTFSLESGGAWKWKDWPHVQMPHDII